VKVQGIVSSVSVSTENTTTSKLYLFKQKDRTGESLPPTADEWCHHFEHRSVGQ